MTSNLSLTELRLDFARERRIASPIAGAIRWAVAGAFGAVFPARFAPMAMFICVGMIFLLGLLVGRFVHENMMAQGNELDALLFKSVIAASLFWAVALPSCSVAPDPRNHLWRSLDDSCLDHPPLDRVLSCHRLHRVNCRRMFLAGP